ncbi:MAG: hypothetical protein J3R72DRAFT_513670 [Linnemannia gamsii]|nr:MAG: hypothetical protein J3R72DRAFT_513670 [Linnemannia gamsii]
MFRTSIKRSSHGDNNASEPKKPRDTLYGHQLLASCCNLLSLSDDNDSFSDHHDVTATATHKGPGSFSPSPVAYSYPYTFSVALEGSNSSSSDHTDSSQDESGRSNNDNSDEQHDSVSSGSTAAIRDTCTETPLSASSDSAINVLPTPSTSKLGFNALFPLTPDPRTWTMTTLQILTRHSPSPLVSQNSRHPQLTPAKSGPKTTFFALLVCEMLAVIVHICVI